MPKLQIRVDDKMHSLLTQARERRHLSSMSEVVRVGLAHFLAWEHRILEGNNSRIAALYRDDVITLNEAHALAGNIEAELKAVEPMKQRREKYNE